MFTNADCTVFNKRFDRDARSDIWIRTYIRGVYWEDSTGIESNRTTGFTSNASLFIAVSDDADTEGKKYLDPNEYKTVSPETAFTFASEDIIIKGIVSENIGGSVTIRDLKKKYNNFYTIVKCIDFRFGGNPHLEVSGR